MSSLNLLFPPHAVVPPVRRNLLQLLEGGLGTDGYISADKGAAFKGEVRRKPSGLITLSGAVNGRPRRQAGAEWRPAPLQGAWSRSKFSFKNALLVPLNGVCLPLFQTAPAKYSLPQCLRYALVFAPPAVLCEREQC